MIFADRSISLRRPDEKPEVLYLSRSNVAVDPETPFVAKVGRRLAPSLVRLSVLLTPAEDVAAASFAIRFGSIEGRLVHEGGLWHVASDDAENRQVPVAGSPLLGGISYALSLCIDFANGIYRDVIVEGQRIEPKVVDVVPGPAPVEESYTVDVLTGGEVDPNMPDWVKAEIAALDASALLELARQHGGRFQVSHMPEQTYEELPRTAPLAQVEDGPAVFTFSVEASSPVLVERVFATEA